MVVAGEEVCREGEMGICSIKNEGRAVRDEIKVMGRAQNQRACRLQ